MLLSPISVGKITVPQPHGGYKWFIKASLKFVYNSQKASEKLFVAPIWLSNSIL
jgi:hypothetical protein